LFIQNANGGAMLIEYATHQFLGYVTMDNIARSGHLDVRDTSFLRGFSFTYTVALVGRTLQFTNVTFQTSASLIGTTIDGTAVTFRNCTFGTSVSYFGSSATNNASVTVTKSTIGTTLSLTSTTLDFSSLNLVDSTVVGISTFTSTTMQGGSAIAVS